MSHLVPLLEFNLMVGANIQEGVLSCFFRKAINRPVFAEKSVVIEGVEGLYAVSVYQIETAEALLQIRLTHLAVEIQYSYRSLDLPTGDFLPGDQCAAKSLDEKAFAHTSGTVNEAIVGHLPPIAHQFFANGWSVVFNEVAAAVNCSVKLVKQRALVFPQIVIFPPAFLSLFFRLLSFSLLRCSKSAD